MSSYKIFRTPPPGLHPFRLPGLAEDAAPAAAPHDLFTADFGAAPETGPAWPADLTAKAREILAQAEAQREHIERQAYEEGFRQGQEDGREVGLKGVEEIARRLKDLLTELASLRDKLFREREEEMVRLALVVARQVVGAELKSDPGLLRCLLEEAFQAFSLAQGLRLSLHPGDLEVLTETAKGGWPPKVEVVADPSLTPGGFRLETALGELDGTLETRWERVTRTVIAALEKVRDEHGD